MVLFIQYYSCTVSLCSFALLLPFSRSTSESSNSTISSDTRDDLYAQIYFRDTPPSSDQSPQSTSSSGKFVISFVCVCVCVCVCVHIQYFINYAHQRKEIHTHVVLLHILKNWVFVVVQCAYTVNTLIIFFTIYGSINIVMIMLNCIGRKLLLHVFIIALVLLTIIIT